MRLAPAIVILISLIPTAAPGQVGQAVRKGRAPGAVPPRDAVEDPPWLRTRLEKVRRRFDLPDLGAAVVIDDKVVAASVVGVRKYGTPIPAERDDPFHLGSITKVMSATLIATFVDDGTLRWDTTMEQMYPELLGIMQPGYRKVTVLQLLSHTSGLPAATSASIGTVTERGRDPTARRYEWVKAAIVDPPAAPPGTRTIYTGGAVYVIAYLERKTGKSYEQLMRERLFRPLGMPSAGISDHMASEGKVDAPWGHRQSDGKTVPIPPDHHSPVNGLQPVGGGYCSMIDLGKFLALHIEGARGRGGCSGRRPVPFIRGRVRRLIALIAGKTISEVLLPTARNGIILAVSLGGTGASGFDLVERGQTHPGRKQAMVSLSNAVVLLCCGVATQSPDRTAEWVVIESKEGPYSFAMPGRPEENGGEAPYGNGQMRWKIYTYNDGRTILIVRQQIYPPGGPQDSPFRAVDPPGNAPDAMFARSTIKVPGASGRELVERMESTNGEAGERCRTRVMIQGPIVYTIMARTISGRPLPPEAAGFFGSVRFDGRPAARPGLAELKAAAKAASRPARRKPLGKIARDDRTADAALRTFLAAMEAGDEETLRAVTLPNPDFDWLLRGEATTTGDLSELKDQVRKARVERLRPGDRVRITPREVHAILPAEVARDRAALKIAGAPAYAPLHLVKGHWKVDPAPLIAARKAAAGAR